MLQIVQWGSGFINPWHDASPELSGYNDTDPPSGYPIRHFVHAAPARACHAHPPLLHLPQDPASPPTSAPSCASSTTPRGRPTRSRTCRCMGVHGGVHKCIACRGMGACMHVCMSHKLRLWMLAHVCIACCFRYNAKGRATRSMPSMSLHVHVCVGMHTTMHVQARVYGCNPAKHHAAVHACRVLTPKQRRKQPP